MNSDDFEEMVVCHVCKEYMTANTDTETCFRCQQKVEKARGSGEDFTNCFDEDIEIATLQKV